MAVEFYIEERWPGNEAEYDRHSANTFERARRVSESIHSIEMEGLSVSAAGQADAGEYIAGRIDSDEPVARARARHGLD